MPIADQYESLVAVRNTELETYWTRYNVQVVLNGGLLVAVLGRQSDDRIGTLPIWLVCFGGIILAACWFVMVLQGKRWIHRWDKQLSQFEQAAGSEQVYPLFTEIRRSAPALNPWHNLTAISLAVPTLSGLTWLALWLCS